MRIFVYLRMYVVRMPPFQFFREHEEDRCDQDMEMSEWCAAGRHHNLCVAALHAVGCDGHRTPHAAADTGLEEGGWVWEGSSPLSLLLLLPNPKLV